MPAYGLDRLDSVLPPRWRVIHGFLLEHIDGSCRRFLYIYITLTIYNTWVLYAVNRQNAATNIDYFAAALPAIAGGCPDFRFCRLRRLPALDQHGLLAIPALPCLDWEVQVDYGCLGKHLEHLRCRVLLLYVAWVPALGSLACCAEPAACRLDRQIQHLSKPRLRLAAIADFARFAGTSCSYCLLTWSLLLDQHTLDALGLLYGTLRVLLAFLQHRHCLGTTLRGTGGTTYSYIRLEPPYGWCVAGCLFVSITIHITRIYGWNKIRLGFIRVGYGAF